MKIKRQYGFQLMVVMFAVLLFVGCASLEKGFKKRVKMEYDQRLNFHT